MTHKEGKKIKPARNKYRQLNTLQEYEASQLKGKKEWDWETGFDSKFPDDDPDIHWRFYSKSVKSFIRSEIAKAKEEGRREERLLADIDVDAQYNVGFTHGKSQALQSYKAELKGRLEKMKIRYTYIGDKGMGISIAVSEQAIADGFQFRTDKEINSYNHAISDIISILEENK